MDVKKYSKQRVMILESLCNRTDHPTAEMLYWDLKKEISSIGIATVYRNLVELYKEGKIRKIKTEEGIDRFDGNTMPHFHFLCNHCHEVYDILLSKKEMKELQGKMGEYASLQGATLKDTQITLRGICKKCHQEKETEKEKHIIM